MKTLTSTLDLTVSLIGLIVAGFKWSGIGRELGKSDIDAFSEIQTLSLAKSKPKETPDGERPTKKQK